MITRTSSGIAIGIASLGMAAGLIGTELAGMSDWDILTPAFLGKALIHLGTVIAAYISGQLVPTAARLKPPPV